VRGNLSRSYGAEAWDLAPTPVEMSADVAISTALLVTERWSRPPPSPCCALVILDFSTACLLSMRCKPVGTGLALHQPTRSSPANDEAQSSSRGADSPRGSPPQTLPVLLKVQVGSWEDNFAFPVKRHITEETIETDMARPFRISHRGGRGQDCGRSVFVRQLVQEHRMEPLPYKQELDTGR